MNRNLKAQLLNTAARPSSSEDSFCRYAHRDCMQNCVEGYDFCMRHILEDKTAPFKQCAYTTKSGRRCPVAAPKLERKDAYCHEHTKKSLLNRQRFSRKRRPKETPENLVEELAILHSGSANFVNHENRRGRNSADSLASKSLEYASSSDSETEAQTVEHTWRDDGDSDADSIDSDQEDMLKYAGIYTTEEVAQILRDKLIRLQALYIDQFKRLRHVLISKRQKYLQTRKAERESLGSVKLYKADPYNKKKYEKLCAMKRYHKKYGREALLQQQSTERRMKATEGLNYQPTTFPKCIFVDEGVQCNAKVVPLSKFCQKHILHDPAQVLYRPCPFGDSQCGRPVPTLFNMEFCSLHHKITPLKDLELEAEEMERKPDLDESEMLHSAQSNQGTQKFTETMEVKMEIDRDEATEQGKKAGPDSTCWDEKEGGASLYTVGEEEEEEEIEDR